MVEREDSEYYLLLKALEEEIRIFIKEELSIENPQWWEQLIPDDVKENAEKRKERDERRKDWDYEEQPLISYIDFPDYEKIIIKKDNWENIFQHVFRDKNSISVKLKEIEPIRNAISHTRNLDSLEIRNIKFYSEEILRGISHYRENKSRLTPKLISLKLRSPKPKMDGFITVSSDRIVYPLDSVIHVRANLRHIIENENIIYEIFNLKEELLLSQTLDPTTCNVSELTKGNIFQVDFKMNGDKWMIGNDYIVKGTYGASYAKNIFTVEQRIPVIQTDQSVYSIHNDLILTIIDPDADKDNQIPEFIGDRNDSKLTIECPYGKIDGYRLKETGNSTAIFQGIIRILGIRGDGSVIKWNIDGEIIDKIQGTGIDDGFIGGKLGDEITITYENDSGVVTTRFFISNYGAIVEIDKRTYRPNDKIYLTVIAPDFNFDYDLPDEIGQEPESMIRIRTGIDELSNYKLVETGNDTGIFTGELQLVDSLEKSSNRYQSKFGPNDGCIACKKDDFIEITFEPFKDKTVIGKASIKP